MKKISLSLQAGAGALRDLRTDGFRAEHVRMIAGASGGAKWLVLSGIDRAILTALAPTFTAPVELIGSSIGAWRFACYAQSDPLSALARFERTYLNLSYMGQPDRQEISESTSRVLDTVLGADGVSQVLGNPVFRTNIVTVRCRGTLQSENVTLLTAGLGVAAAANLVSRPLLGAFFSRSLFFDPRLVSPLATLAEFQTETTPLSVENLRDAIFASGAIPVVLNGVKDIRGAPSGMFRDGGIIDYHLDLPLSRGNGITLYPHFYGRITPGWFDKRLTWRKADPGNFDRVLLISPSAEFVAQLPGGKIPDRTDFRKLDTEVRQRVWAQVVSESRRLGDELLEVIADGSLAERVTPLD